MKHDYDRIPYLVDPDKEMHEIPGATHYDAGPDQRDKLRQAVGIITDWLVRHDFASAE